MSYKEKGVLSCSHASPSLQSSHPPTSKQRALRSNDRKSPLHRILRCQHRDLTLEIFAAEIGSFWGETVQKAPTLSQFPRAKYRITHCRRQRTRKSHAKQAKAQATRTSQKKYPHPLRRKPTVLPRIQFSHQTVPTETTLHLGPHGLVDAVFLQALCDSCSRNIHDVGPADALRRYSCGVSHHYDTHRFSALQPQSCLLHSSHSPN